jgi:hypothetical protein
MRPRRVPHAPAPNRPVWQSRHQLDRRSRQRATRREVAGRLLETAATTQDTALWMRAILGACLQRRTDSQTAGPLVG